MYQNPLACGLYQVSTTSAMVPSSPPLCNVVYVNPHTFQPQPHTFQSPVQMPYQAPQMGSLLCDIFLKTRVSHVRNAPFDHCRWKKFTILPGTKVQVWLDKAHPLWACVMLPNGELGWIGIHHI